MNTIEILQQCTVDGNVVKLPSRQLERNEYLDVKKALELIGGKWKSGKVQGFVFTHDPAELLAQIATGEKRNLKKEFQFFETPASIADRLVELADINYNDTVLEPSAGQGAIVKAIHRAHPYRTVCGYELMAVNQTFLSEIERFELLGSDFLKECTCQFDVIIANPPFSKNQDIDHIYKMFEYLYPGGRLVSIASIHWQFAGGKKETAFHKWLEKNNAEILPLEKGAFQESGTMIESCIIVIQKQK